MEVENYLNHTTMRTFLLIAILPLLFTLASCEREEAVVAPEAVDHLFLIGEDTKAYNYGFQIESEEVVSDGITTLHQYEFMLLEKDIYRQGYLSGISDMMVVNVLSLSGPVTDFNVELGAAGSNPDDQVHVYSRFCKGMNFSSGTNDDDVSISSGEMSLVSNDDGTKTLTINGVTGFGKKVNGSWTGEFVPAKTSY